MLVDCPGTKMTGLCVRDESKLGRGPGQPGQWRSRLTIISRCYGNYLPTDVMAAEYLAPALRPKVLALIWRMVVWKPVKGLTPRNQGST